MNTRRGRGKPTATASSSSSVKNAPPTVKPRGTRRNGLHNITNTKSDESNSDPIIDSADEGEPEAEAEQPSATKNPANKRLHSPASVTGSASKKRRSKSTEVDAASMELALYNAIRKTLTKHYFDVVTRLQLNFQPSCMTNLEYCATFHIKEGYESNEIDNYLVKDARNFVIEDRPQEFLKFVAKMSIQNEFPGKVLLLTLLELILTVNQMHHGRYTTTYIIHTANKLFEDIIVNFPPCWIAVADSYKKLLDYKLHITLDKKKYDTNIGIARLVLCMLENVLMEEDLFDGEESQSSELDASMDISWEAKQRQRYLFDILRRDDKIERIFVVLNLLITLMESDLAIWIIRHPKNTNITMSKPKKMPLIGYFLWPAEACGQINALIKKILNLFVISISIGMPTEKVDILSRFVNLVANAINLCELQPKSDVIKFPLSQSYTECFALEIKKTIENIQTCNVDLILAVIDHIKAPFIQIIAIDQLLMKFNRDAGKPSMRKLYNNFAKKRWTECDEEGSRKIFLYIPADSTSPQYPVYRPLTQKQKLSDIYQKDYLHLLLSSFHAYQVLYQVEAVMRTIESEEDDSEKLNVSVGEKVGKKFKIQKQINAKFNFIEMEKDIEKLEGILERTAALDLIDEPPAYNEMLNIQVNADTVSRYREDTKYYLQLRTLIGKYYEEYGDIFAKWNDAIKCTDV